MKKQKTEYKQTEIGEIPEDWEVNSASGTVDIISGGTPKTSVNKYWNGDIPWLSVVDFNNDQRHVYASEKHITKAGLDNSSANMLKKGSLIISARGTVGILTQLGKDMAFNQSCYGLNAKKQAINDYLYYAFKNQIKAIKQNTHGSVFSTITRKTFENILLSLPPLDEQKEIASVLSSLDDKIELNRRTNKSIEEIGKALFKHWFVDFEFPNKDGKPYKSIGGKMVNSELGKKPKGWELGKLKDLIEITSGKRPKVKVDDKVKGFNVPIIGASGIMGYTSDILYDEKIIVTGRVGTLGLVQKIEYPCWMSDNALVIKSEYYEYVYRILSSIDFSSLNVGSTQPLVTQTSLKSIDVVIPQAFVLLMFEKYMRCLTLKAITNDIENRLVESIRNSLLPRLMSGRLRVN